jgi:DNA-binding transcriptional ArsR family regulator
MSRMEDSPAPADAYEALFTALAHPARRRILISLNFAGGEMSAGAIARLFGHAWPTTTRHLHLLETAGIVSAERRGRSRVYRVRTRPLALARDWLDWFGKDPCTAEERDDERSAEAVPAERRSGRH